MLPLGTRVPAVLRPGDELCLLVVHSLPTVECGCRISGSCRIQQRMRRPFADPRPICKRNSSRAEGIVLSAYATWLFSQSIDFMAFLVLH